jgi:hypothetical protein
MAERLNGKIKDVRLVGREYRIFENFRSAILFFSWWLESLPTKMVVEPYFLNFRSEY